MKTLLTRSAETAASIVKNGGLVAFPTETVYGLGAAVFDAAALAKIFEAKQRPADNPLIVHVSSVSQIDLLTATVTESARLFIDAFFPGPLTVVLKKSPAVPILATAGLETVAVRMPYADLARRLIDLSGTPIAAPSANISGRPSPTTWQSVLEDLDGRIDCILQDEPTVIGLESTVVDCTGVSPVILRAGSITLEQLKSVVAETRERDMRNDAAIRSPGMKHRHYSPRAIVKLIGPGHEIATGKECAYIGLHRRDGDFELSKICETVEEYARNAFEFFRECDRAGVRVIYCECVTATGIGAALMDRIARAAAG